MKLLKRFSILVFLALAGCVNDASDGNAAAPAPKPSATPPPAAAVAVPEATGVPAAPAPAPAVKAPEPPAAASAPVVKKAPEPPPPAPRVSPEKKIKFRCAYWSRPENPQEFFIKIDGEYQCFEMFTLSFPKVFSVPASEPVRLYTKNGDEYVPYCEIPTAGLEDCAAIIFPGFDPAREEDLTQRLHLFNFADSASPAGSIVLYNWFEKNTLKGEFVFKEDGNAPGRTETFSLGYGEFCTTTPISGERQLCGIKLFSGEIADENILYSSNLALRNNSCVFICVFPSGDADGKVEFKIFKKYSK